MTSNLFSRAPTRLVVRAADDPRPVFEILAFPFSSKQEEKQNEKTKFIYILIV